MIELGCGCAELPDSLKIVLGVGSTEEYVEREPRRLTKRQIRHHGHRIRELRALLAHASRLGHRFDDEYSESPQSEIARLQRELREHYTRGPIRESVAPAGMLERVFQRSVEMFQSGAAIYNRAKLARPRVE
jgi:Mg2+ and Co2+ transporter CorA